MSSHEQLEVLYEKGFIVFPQKEGGQPMYKQYVGPGVFVQDIWAYQPNTHGVLFNSEECIDEDVKFLKTNKSGSVIRRKSQLACLNEFSILVLT